MLFNALSYLLLCIHTLRRGSGWGPNQPCHPSHVMTYAYTDGACDPSSSSHSHVLELPFCLCVMCKSQLVHVTCTACFKPNYSTCMPCHLFIGELNLASYIYIYIYASECNKNVKSLISFTLKSVHPHLLMHK